VHSEASDIDPRAADKAWLYRSIFVGRDAEVHQLQSAYDAAANGRPALVALAGEPGIGNREIATTLVISENTAEVHVKHILSKLGLKSRSQVVAWAARRDLH
jgi:FixJ family two-component response regulator